MTQRTAGSMDLWSDFGQKVCFFKIEDPACLLPALTQLNGCTLNLDASASAH